MYILEGKENAKKSDEHDSNFIMEDYALRPRVNKQDEETTITTTEEITTTTEIVTPPPPRKTWGLKFYSFFLISLLKLK